MKVKFGCHDVLAEAKRICLEDWGSEDGGPIGEVFCRLISNLLTQHAAEVDERLAALEKASDSVERLSRDVENLRKWAEGAEEEVEDGSSEDGSPSPFTHGFVAALDERSKQYMREAMATAAMDILNEPASEYGSFKGLFGGKPEELLRGDEPRREALHEFEAPTILPKNSIADYERRSSAMKKALDADLELWRDGLAPIAESLAKCAGVESAEVIEGEKAIRVALRCAPGRPTPSEPD